MNTIAGGCILAWVIAIMWTVEFRHLLPVLFSLCRSLLPEDADKGAVPMCMAKAASLLKRFALEFVDGHAAHLRKSLLLTP